MAFNFDGPPDPKLAEEAKVAKAKEIIRSGSALLKIDGEQLKIAIKDEDIDDKTFDAFREMHDNLAAILNDFGRAGQFDKVEHDAEESDAVKALAVSMFEYMITTEIIREKLSWNSQSTTSQFLSDNLDFVEALRDAQND